MLLNVLGRLLSPYGPHDALTDERNPICVTITETFRDWCLSNGFSELIDGKTVGTMTRLEPDVWTMAYKDGCAPPMSAEHSHETAVYWFPIEMFEIREEV
jgi:hypothetical protein